MWRVVRLSMIFCAILLCLGACKPYQMTDQEKAEVEELKKELLAIQNDVAETEKELSKNSTGLIPSLMRVRIETSRLTQEIIRQRIAAIESGAHVTVVTQTTQKDENQAAAISKEIENTKTKIVEIEKESAKYSGGLIKLTLDARAATEQLTLSKLNQQYLHYKFGLYTPILNDVAAKTEKVTSKEEASASTEKQQMAVTEQTAMPQEEKIQDPGPFDFRHARWGMNMQEVMDRESGNIKKHDNETLALEEKTLGKKTVILFIFDDDRLYKAGFVLDEKYINDNNYVDDYHEIVGRLKQKYGKPSEEKTYWSDNLYKGRHEKRGMSYATGKTSSYCEWVHNGTKISARIHGENFKITVAVIYSSIAMEKEVENKKKKKQDENI